MEMEAAGSTEASGRRGGASGRGEDRSVGSLERGCGVGGDGR